MNLANHFLVVMPDMDDLLFDGNVVCICEHNKDGALGLIINKLSSATVDLASAASDRNIPLRFQGESVMMSGPVHAGRGYVVHTPVGNRQNSVAVMEDIALMSLRDITENPVDPKKVVKALVSIGYPSWGKGQLEQELTDNVWLIVSVDEGISFSALHENRRSAAFTKLGIEPASLTYGAGHA